MKISTLPVLAVMLALAGCGGRPAPDPAKINVAQHSSYAVVLLRVDPAQEDFDVNLMAYDEAAQSLGIHLFTDAIRFHIPGAYNRTA